MWSGEFWGKLAIGACRVYEYTKDESLKNFVHESAKRVLSYARPDEDFRVKRWLGDYTPALTLPRDCMMTTPCS